MYFLKAQVKDKGNFRRTTSVTNKRQLITLNLAFWKPKVLMCACEKRSSIRGGPYSQPQSNLCCLKPPTVKKKKTLTPP